MAKEPDGLAVYPGTFDPLTNGHRSLVRRGLEVFRRIVVAVARDTPKTTLFSLEERVELAKAVFANEPRVEVEPFSGLLVDYVASRGAATVLRGLRAVSDFEHEFQMALVNRRLNRDIQTVFLMTDYKWFYVSSTVVKEIARHHGNVCSLVPTPVAEALQIRFGGHSPA